MDLRWQPAADNVSKTHPNNPMPQHSARQAPDALIELLGLDEDLPDLGGHVLECLLEALVLVLAPHERRVRHLADVDGLDPLRVGSVDLGVGLWVGLRGVADADDSAVRDPGVDLLETVCLVPVGCQR